MSLIRRKIIDKIIDRDSSPISMKELEKDYKVLKEHLLYGQGLVNVGSWIYDINNDEVFWSDEIYNILESNPKELRGYLEDFYSYVHPDYIDDVKEAVSKAIAGEEYEIEYGIITSIGTEKYLHEKAKVLYDEEKRPIKIIGTIQDITRKKLIEKDLMAFGSNLNEAQKVAGIGSWKYDVLEDEVFWSEEAYKIHNIDPESFEKKFANFTELINPEDRLKTKMALEDCLEGKPYKLNYRILQKGGLEKHVVAKGEPIFGETGQVIGIIGTVQDITEKVELKREIQIKQNEVDKIAETFKILVQESNDVFEIIDGDGTIKYISRGIEKITDYSPKDYEGKKIYDFFKGKELEKLKKMVDFVLKNPSKKAQEDIIFKTTQGKDIYLAMNMKNLFAQPAIKGIVINYRDITERIKMEKENAYKATHDELTGLPNSIYFSKELNRQCEYANENRTEFALMMLDIDGLKYVNYTLGYEYGDKLIIEIIKRLKGFLSDDVFLSRFSEDHFAIIIQGLDKFEYYKSIAKGIIELFGKSYKIESYQVNILVNIGICIFPGDVEDMKALKRQSKIALMRAKKQGENRYQFYYSDMDIKSYKEFVLRSDLHDAIEKEQLRLYYQPIVNINNNKVLGAEALVRWEHPDWGMILPGEFTSLAEESGMIVDIGKWVLRRACEDYKRWKEKELSDIKISINFSVIELLEKDFVENIVKLMDEYQLDPKFLIMEITENIVMKKYDKAISDIKTLQSYGVQVAIDDFGTGFSSMSYLQYFNTDILKIDKSFVENVPENSINKSIIESIISLSKGIENKIVVEGIEDWDQLNYLRSLKCVAVQGYLFSKPIPSIEFEEILVKKLCMPSLAENTSILPYEERRKFFRIELYQLLEANLTILELRGKGINIGHTKILIKNIGPGGLCFISNIKFPVEKDIILQFTTELLGKEIKLYGNTVWSNEMHNDLYQYGVEFTIDENERTDLIGNLNQIQIKMRKNELLAQGRFITGTYRQYFSPQNKGK